jgi:hypothetical protein
MVIGRHSEGAQLPKYLTPAECVIRAFGGVRKTAKAIGRTPSNISKWTRRCEGVIPEKTVRTVLEQAEAMGLDLTARDLILGRKIEDAQ